MAVFRASSSFTVTSWQDEPYDDAPGATLKRARLTKHFAGDIIGYSTVEMLMAQAGQGSAAYVALERLNVGIYGVKGTFVLKHDGVMTAAGQTATWEIVPNSGTGALETIRGTGVISIMPDGTHQLVLDYELST